MLEDAPDFDTMDMIYMGAGTERGQKAALTALTPYASCSWGSTGSFSGKSQPRRANSRWIIKIYVRKAAPLGDPLEIMVRGCELSLRKADAEMVEVR